MRPAAMNQLLGASSPIIGSALTATGVERSAAGDGTSGGSLSAVFKSRHHDIKRSKFAMVDLGPNPSEEYNGYGVIAFLDILGFSNAVWCEWPSALSRLLNIKDADGIKTKGITFAVERPQSACSFFIPTIRTFSDSFILLAPWQQKLPPLEQIAAFMSIAANIRFFWKAAVKEGFVVRGVIEVGNIYWSESDVIGPAAASAIHLEKKADSARIILGPKLLLALSELEGKNKEYGDG
jgi:hypothetical protein